MKAVEPTQWARVRGDVNCRLRRGAWYRVRAVTQNDVVVDVHGDPRLIERPMVRLAQARPVRWSVVSRPVDAAQPPASWGARYGVCPACQTRAAIESLATWRRCDQCHGLFPIDWNEP